jgi:hypothetical protein
MVTEKTPAHKRIARAEKSAVEWKMKAIERREETELLTGQLARANEIVQQQAAALSDALTQLEKLQKQVVVITKNFEKSRLEVAAMKLEMYDFKKKASR